MDQDTNSPRIETLPVHTPWQYSLRGLLIVTTVISICLAVGIYFAGVMFVLAVMALTQAATLLAADWLIRPQNRRALAAVSSGSWMILGSGLGLIGGRQLYLLHRDDGAAGWVFALSLAAAGLYCFPIGLKRWRRLTSAPPRGCGHRKVVE